MEPLAHEKSRDKATASGLRPVDPARDMPEIVELIAQGFENELDPQGRKMLAQMRRAARYRAMSRLIGDPNPGPTGFVWVEDQRVVGNLSLRYALPGRSRGEIIGNVVVHPDYRGMGIARALVEAALEAARAQQSRWVGLEVRERNHVALGLYARFGFRPVGKQLHLLRPAKVPWPDFVAPARSWQVSKPKDRLAWTDLANKIYDRRQRWVLEVRPSLFNFGGFERKFNQWLSRERERAWLSDDESARLALRVKTDFRYRFHLWDMLMHPEEDVVSAHALVSRALWALRRFPPWPVIAFVADQAPLVQTLYGVGFRLHRTLIQMVLEL